VVHAVTADESARLGLTSTSSTRVGFVVSKAVGNAVVRHRVTRRLRHVVRDRLDAVQPGSTLVVRALPSSATAPSTELGSDFDSALRRLRLVDPDPGDAE
jgi:ribonuclease P protein component